jgi:hypothetical protein
MTKRVDLDAVEARAKAATPGPWELREHEGLSAICHPHGWVLEDSADADMRDRRFIAAAREDVPALCAEVRALRELVAPLVVLRDAPFAWAPAVYSEVGSGFDGQRVLDRVTDAWDAITAALAKLDTERTGGGL